MTVAGVTEAVARPSHSIKLQMSLTVGNCSFRRDTAPYFGKMKEFSERKPAFMLLGAQKSG